MNVLLLKTSRARVSVALLTLTLGLLSCTNKDSTPVELGIKSQTLHLGNGAEPSSLDPQITTGLLEYRIHMALFEGLTSRDPKTLAPVPGVAERWEVSSDGLQYHFHIRKDAKWSNGDDLVADDFVWSWRRALMPALGNQYAYSLFVVKNAEDFNQGKITNFSDVGVHALGPKELQVTLRSPTPYFLDLLDHHSTYPVHRATIEKAGAMDDRSAQWTIPGKMVGNGAFVLKDWQPNKVLAVEKNKTYWDTASVKLNEIHFYPIENLATEERMFRAGQLHRTAELPIEKIASYREAKAVELRVSPFLGTYFYRLNVNAKPLNDVRVRQALAMSIDRKMIVEKVTKGEQLPAFNFTPHDLNGYTPQAEIPYDIIKAKQLLADAGYADGVGFPKLEIVYNTQDDHQKVAVAIQQIWKQTLNIEVTLQNQDWKVFLDNVRGGNFQIARASWFGDYLDPNTFLEMWLTGGGNNHTNWSSQQYDGLISRASNMSDVQQRLQYFQHAEAVLMNEVPIIPIYSYTSKHLQHASIRGMYDNILDIHPYKYVYLESSSQ